MFEARTIARIDCNHVCNSILCFLCLFHLLLSILSSTSQIQVHMPTEPFLQRSFPVINSAFFLHLWNPVSTARRCSQLSSGAGSATEAFRYDKSQIAWWLLQHGCSFSVDASSNRVQTNTIRKLDDIGWKNATHVFVGQSCGCYIWRLSFYYIANKSVTLHLWFYPQLSHLYKIIATVCKHLTFILYWKLGVRVGSNCEVLCMFS